MHHILKQTAPLKKMRNALEENLFIKNSKYFSHLVLTYTVLFEQVRLLLSEICDEAPDGDFSAPINGVVLVQRESLLRILYNGSAK